jgi:DNA/RNA-binding domain of Phe-tRNA-synthetase-like protein
MLPLAIDPELRAAVPGISVGCLTAEVEVADHNPALWEAIEALAARWQPLSMEDVRRLAPVKALRDAYRALGNDPTRYRGSNEALLRRIVHGRGLYRVNTLVDINNLLSLESLCSCGVLDLDRVEPPVVFRKGRTEESYAGIGRGEIRLENIPIFADAAGPFASTTSDSERTRITTATGRALQLIISFGDGFDMDKAVDRAAELLRRYAGARQLESAIFR